MNKKSIKFFIMFCFVVFLFSSSAVHASPYWDLNCEQKQKYWQLWKAECQQLLIDKNYSEYRACSLNVMIEAGKFAPKADEFWCEDSDGIDYFTKGVVKTNLYPDGKEDFSYTYPNGKSYVFEGACSNTNKIFYYVKNCAELGDYKAEDGVCVTINHAPVITPIGDKIVSEGAMLLFDVFVNDEDADELSLEISELPGGASFEWLPAASSHGHALATHRQHLQREGSRERR